MIFQKPAPDVQQKGTRITWNIRAAFLPLAWLIVKYWSKWLSHITACCIVCRTVIHKQTNRKGPKTDPSGIPLVIPRTVLLMLLVRVLILWNTPPPLLRVCEWVLVYISSSRTLRPISFPGLLLIIVACEKDSTCETFITVKRFTATVCGFNPIQNKVKLYGLLLLLFLSPLFFRYGTDFNFLSSPLQGPSSKWYVRCMRLKNNISYLS